MIKKVSSYFLPSVVLILLSLQVVGQQKIPAIESWRVHLPYSNNNTLCENGNKIYVGSASGIFTYDENDKSVEILSRVNGLSDVNVKILANNPTTNSIIVIYNNTNIDVIEGTTIYNINDILNQITIGEKRINNISFYNEFAYLSSSIGIIVVDMKKKLIVDSYSNLGANGSNVEFFDAEVFQNYLYLSSANGIYKASMSSFNLSDYHSWSMFTTSGNTNLLATFRNKLYAIIDSTLQTYDGTIWSTFSPIIKNPITMQINHGKLVCTTSKNIYIEDELGGLQTKNLNALNGSLIANEDMIFTISNDGGLILNHVDGSMEYFFPSGPVANTATRMTYNINDNSLLVAAGSIVGFGTTGGWGPNYNNNKFYRFTDNTWYNYTQTGNPKIDNARDFIDVSIDPITNHAFFATLGHGLYEISYQPNLSVTVYDTTNSTLKDFVGSGVWVTGSCFDKNGNLWVSNFGVTKELSVKNRNNQWFSYKIPIDTKTAFITTDDNNYKWVLNSSNQGILIYDDKNDPSNSLGNHQTKTLTKDKLNGFLPSNVVFCATKDMKGEMWVGTDQGLCVFSNTQNIFTANGNFDAQQIVIKTGLVYSNFLGTEAIYCIKVDAANRKWIGTKNGVWLVSEDGYTVLKNFTTNNSPLLANAVYEIGINDKTGEVFFATENGIISYSGTATIGTDEQGEALIYPNPVRPDYHGLIAIRGLVNDANVKITDIAGNLVYETKSNGGMATWNGLNLTGKRAATGVYIIYSSNSDATQQWVGKILFIN